VRLRRGRRRGGGQQDIEAVTRKFEELSPEQRIWLLQVIIGVGLLAGSSPIELSVPVIRTLLQKRGVQTGAPLGSLLSFFVAQACLVVIRRSLESKSSSDEGSDRDHWFDRWMTEAILANAVVLPAVGGLVPGTVVMRKRSPLWGLALWLLVRLVAAVVLAVDASRLKKRREAETGESAATSADKT
jgi:hypothetical protein